MVAKEVQRVQIERRAELRSWLKKHHAQNEGIWLVSFKKAVPKKHVPHEAIIEEALCFGWIDSVPRSLDDERWMIRLSPRKRGSAWSKANRARAEALIRAGRMTAAGREKIEAAKADGSWDFLVDVQRNVVPPDLAAALEAHPPARDRFDAFPPSSKRIILEWIKQAKKPETRAKRVLETALKAAKNIRANHYRQ
ncbi:MAG: YdeI/OmpD-associated family protein [Deltaproteobacteria bacterium]|nr:YdeI/OmpD-associated family protein [Deltaproteobacteria bacterium]